MISTDTFGTGLPSGSRIRPTTNICPGAGRGESSGFAATGDGRPAGAILSSSFIAMPGPSPGGILGVSSYALSLIELARATTLTIVQLDDGCRCCLYGR